MEQSQIHNLEEKIEKQPTLGGVMGVAAKGFLCALLAATPVVAGCAETIATSFAPKYNFDQGLSPISADGYPITINPPQGCMSIASSFSAVPFRQLSHVLPATEYNKGYWVQFDCWLERPLKPGEDISYKVSITGPKNSVTYELKIRRASDAARKGDSSTVGDRINFQLLCFFQIKEDGKVCSLYPWQSPDFCLYTVTDKKKLHSLIRK